MTTYIHNEIEKQLLSIKPFELRLNALNASRDYAGVSYTIEPQQPVDEIKQALHETSAFFKEPTSRRNIPAHMTIVEFLSIDDGLALCRSIRDQVPTGSFMCDGLLYLVPDEQFRFCTVATFPFGGA